MEVEKYKMIYTRKVNKKLIFSVWYKKEVEIKDEIVSDKMRILGNDFVKKNKNKGKLIINNKKYKLKEFINDKEIKDDRIKINMILSKNYLILVIYLIIVQN